MNVCMLTSSFPRTKKDCSGLFVYELATDLVRKGIKVSVVTPHDRGCRFVENYNGIKVYRFPYFYPLKLQQLAYGNGILKNIQKKPFTLLQIPLMVIMQMIVLLVVFRKTKGDVIHAHWSVPQGGVALFLSRITGAPCVVSIHGSDVFGINMPVLKEINSYILRKSSRLTANSRATANKALTLSGRVVDAIIPMGVNPAVFYRKQVPDLREKLGIDGRIVLFTGRLVRQKGAHHLIEAMPNVLSEFPDSKLVVVGDGMERVALERLSEELAVQDSVVFTGEVGPDEISDYYNIADVFVMPSVTGNNGAEEGLGVVLLEAMLCGVPVIGSDTGGITDIILDGETGLLVEPGSSGEIAMKIKKIFSDPALSKRLVDNGAKKLRNSLHGM